ncbi:phage N-6-adenine-methyltransferase [Rodentibacter trehalosifermentans]|uniref:Phage N-6-adenine-methyltransferase n=1 Tax=Rodentibacter trehalosifermentans TaxID=1908263 RepID=A0A1V3IVN8_9PAST|nr:phage N-6-adenine-methyltransferase [Rodentibacter trehalosifermentans]OOF45987.1 phage N-6-adenine-methyltransferase [Rodentibacter trehalosifermentans]OOF48621.1 phage N-6-adenine-methyltransferase [Rodentibacter trehalosifermentans]
MTEFNKDHYRTPKYVFNWLNKRFNFKVDGCASKDNALCAMYCTDDENGGFLNHKSILKLGCSIFVNPPYSDPSPFAKRAVELMAQGHLVVMLLPADKSTKWYKVIQDNATEVIDIIGGRINFLHPVTGQEVKGNNKGSIVAVFDPFMQGFITRQVELDFVKKFG